METLYGRNPKRIFCQCNEEEMTEPVVTLALNDRCPVCGTERHICIPKRAIKVKQVPLIGGMRQQVA